MNNYNFNFPKKMWEPANTLVPYLLKYFQRYAFFFLFLFLGVFTPLLHAQAFDISYPSGAEGMTVCLNESTLSINIEARPTTTTTDVLITIDMAPGVSYVPTSLVNTSSVPAAAYELVEEDISNLAAPVFRVVAAGTSNAATMSFGHSVGFTINRAADCAARTHSLAGGTFKDIVTAMGSAGSVSEDDLGINNYNVQFPSITFTQPAAINDAVLGDTPSRVFTIANGALGAADNIYFYLVYPDGGITQNSLTLAGVGPISPTTSNGDTLFYTLSGAQLGADNLLTNGEVLSFTENITINACNASTAYRIGWGCNSTPANWCQTVSGSGSLSMGTGVGRLAGFTVARAPGFVDMCGTGNGGFVDMIATWTWGGTGDPTAAAAFDINLRIGGSSSSPQIITLPSVYSSITDFEINGNPIPPANVSFSGGIVVINLEDVFNFDPDGPGGLSDLDNDGFFDDLLPGQTLASSFRIAINCNPSCGLSISSSSSFASEVRYNSMCGNSTLTTRVGSGAGGSWEESSWGSSSYAPANIVNGVPFTVRLSAGFQRNVNFMDNADTRYEYWLVLPPGLNVLGNTTWTNGVFPNNNTAIPHTFTQSNDTLYITSPSNVFGYVNIDLAYDCAAAGGTPNFTTPFGIRKINNITTACKCFENKVCSSFSFSTLCPGVCGAGPVNRIPTVRRADGSLGWTDNTLTTRQAASNISTYNLSRALYLDTILLLGSAIQSNAANDLRMRLEHTRPNNLDALIPIDIDYEIWRAGTLLTNGTLSSSSDGGSAGTTQRIDWDLNAGLPIGGLMPGDSIYSVSSYVLGVNDPLPKQDVQSGINWYYYNLVAGVREHCNSFTPEMYLVGTNKVNASNAIASQSCSTSDLGIPYLSFFSRRFSNAGLRFTEEFRPTIYYDSIVVVMPDSYEFIQSEFRTESGYNSPSQSIPISPDYIDGDKYVFINDGTWQSGQIEVTNRYSNFFRFRVRPTCSTIPSTPVVQRVYGKDFYYAQTNTTDYAAGSTGNVLGKSFSIVHSNKGNLVVSDQTGTVQAASPQESWNIRLANNGVGTTPYTWIAIPTQTSASVVDVVDIATNTSSPSMAYPGGVWYQLSTVGLASGATADYRIDFNYTSCSLDSLQVLAGWNCGAFPTSPDDYPCNTQELYLKFDPVASEIEVSAVTVPNSIDLCSPTSFEFLVNNAQASNVVSNTFTIEALVGVFIDLGSIEAQYPAGSGSWETMPSSVDGAGNTVVNLTAHSQYPAQGIPGVLNAANNEERQIAIRFDFDTDCDFVSGSSFTISTAANAPCGVLALGSNVPLSRNISINNLPTLTATNNTITVTGDLEGCSSNASVMVLTQFSGATTSASGQYRVTLPPYIEYVPASLNCALAPCPSFVSAITQPDNSQVLIFDIPSGIVSGSTLSFSFEVSDNISAPCGDLNIALITQDQLNNIACPTASGGFCPSIVVNTGSGEASVTVSRSALALDGLIACPLADGSISASGILQINDRDLAAGQSVTLRYYCTDAMGNPMGSPVATETINGPLALASSTPFGQNLTTCDINNNIAVEAFGCACDTIRQNVVVDRLAIVEAGNPQTICATAVVDLTSLGASINPNDLDAVWTSSGAGLFNDGAGEFGVATTYSPSPADIAAGSVSLILTATDPTGSCPPVEDQVLITILHVDCGTFPWAGN